MKVGTDTIKKPAILLKNEIIGLVCMRHHK